MSAAAGMIHLNYSPVYFYQDWLGLLLRIQAIHNQKFIVKLLPTDKFHESIQQNLTFLFSMDEKK